MKADSDAPFLAAARGRRPARRPLWIMRQAGRYLPEYRAVRGELSFLELCNTPSAATEVTLQPLRRYDLDAAILFTDLLVPLVPMGLELRYEPGPVLGSTVTTMAQVEALRVPDPQSDLTPMLSTATAVREALTADKALIGFVGAPFTMACYMVEGRGSKSWDGTRRLMHGEAATFDALLAKIAECLQPLVAALVAAGCDAVQVFDSWAHVLSADDYARRCAPHTDRLLQTARDCGAIAIDFVNGATQHFDRMLQSPAHMLAVDWRQPMSRLRAQAGPDRPIQGNLDPTALFAPRAQLREQVRAICAAAGPHHVFNLGHGILPDTDPDAVAAVVEEVHAS